MTFSKNRNDFMMKCQFKTDSGQITKTVLPAAAHVEQSIFY